MNIEKSYLESNFDIIEPLLMKELGIKRLKRFVSYPDYNITRDEEYGKSFSALCEYVTFNECFVLPFYKTLKKALEGKLFDLYLYLKNDNSILNEELSPEEAYYFLSSLDPEKAETIIKICSSSIDDQNNLSSALEKDDNALFVAMLSDGQYSEWLKFLWVLRLIKYGLQYQPQNTNAEWLEINNVWKIDLVFSDFMRHYKDEKIFNTGRLILYYKGTDSYEKACLSEPYFEINGKDLKTLYNENLMDYRDLPKAVIEQEFSNIVSNDYCIGGDYYSGWLDRLEDFFPCQEVFRDRFEKIPIHISKNKINNYLKIAEYYLLAVCDVHGAWDWVEEFEKPKKGLPLFVPKYPINPRSTKPLNEQQIHEFSDYVFYLTHLAQKVFSIIKNVIDKESGAFLYWLLDTSKYSKALMSLYTESSLKIEDEINMFGSDSSNDEHQTANFILKEPLSDVELETLYNCLKDTTKAERRFINPTTRLEDLKYVLGGEKPKNYRPIDWIKKTSKGKPSKKSVLNFLRYLGVDWGDFTLEKLNHCFKVGTVPFDHKNLNDNKGLKEKNKNRIDALSDCFKDLLSIMDDVFKDNQKRRVDIDKIPLQEK